MLQHETLITNNLFDLLSLKYELTLFRLFMKLLIKTSFMFVPGTNQY